MEFLLVVDGSWDIGKIKKKGTSVWKTFSSLYGREVDGNREGR